MHGAREIGIVEAVGVAEALVRDELRGTLELRSGDGLRAEVVFPA